MYCVVCGIPMTDETQVGLICTDCKGIRIPTTGGPNARERVRSVTITVNYCFTCGSPYRPNNNTIEHTYHMFAMRSA